MPKILYEFVLPNSGTRFQVVTAFVYESADIGTIAVPISTLANGRGPSNCNHNTCRLCYYDRGVVGSCIENAIQEAAITIQQDHPELLI